MLFVLDTGCLIAAQTPEERYHLDCVQLVEMGRTGAVDLAVGTAAHYDWEAARPHVVQARLRWLDDRPFIRRIPGPTALDVSPMDSGDILVDDEQATVLKRLHALFPLLTAPVDDRQRRRQFDFLHVAAAYLAGADALVTTDQDDLLKRSSAIAEITMVSVLDPTEAVKVVRSAGRP